MLRFCSIRHYDAYAWLGRRFCNRTFEEEISKVDVEEIRELLDDPILGF